MISQGHPRLVNALAKMYGKLYDREIDPMNEVSLWKYIIFSDTKTWQISAQVFSNFKSGVCFVRVF